MKHKQQTKVRGDSPRTPETLNRISVSNGMVTTEVETTETLDDCFAMLKIVQESCFNNGINKLKPKYVG